MVLIEYQVFRPWSGRRRTRCRSRDVLLKRALFGRTLYGAAVLALLMWLGPAFVERARADTPAAGANSSGQADGEESMESIELRTMGPREGGPVWSDCARPFGELNIAAVCVPLTPALFASLRGLTRSQVTAIMGASGRVDYNCLQFTGNYLDGFTTRRMRDTGHVDVCFEDRKVVRIDADLRGQKIISYRYYWSHRSGAEEIFCSDLPEFNKPCKNQE
jgi:hypothetical protein